MPTERQSKFAATGQCGVECAGNCCKAAQSCGSVVLDAVVVNIAISQFSDSSLLLLFIGIQRKMSTD